jgi:hypothetical protein
MGTLRGEFQRGPIAGSDARGANKAGHAGDDVFGWVVQGHSLSWCRITYEERVSGSGTLGCAAVAYEAIRSRPAGISAV